MSNVIRVRNYFLSYKEIENGVLEWELVSSLMFLDICMGLVYVVWNENRIFLYLEIRFEIYL